MKMPKTLHEADQMLFREVVAAVKRSDAPEPDKPGTENMWQTMRIDIREEFRNLATRGFLTKDAAEWARDTFNLGAVIKPVVNVKAGHATIDYVPTFELFEAKAAYVLLRLSAVEGAHFGICKRCGDLWFDDRKVAGRKREGFCSDAHRNAYAQAEFRRRAKASKHK